MGAAENLSETEKEELAFASSNLSKIFTENTHRMADYEKRKYLPAVQEICRTYLPYLKVYHGFCVNHPDKGQAAAAYVAEAFLSQVKEFTEERLSGRKWKDRVLMEQYRMVMAAFVVPCLKEMKAENGQALVDAICSGWKKLYPDFPFQQTDIMTLQNGFKMRLFF